MDALVALGETVPEAALPDYLRALLTAGKREEAKQVIATLDPTPRLDRSPGRVTERSPTCGRIEDLIRVYEKISQREPRFFGRIKRLKKKMGVEGR